MQARITRARASLQEWLVGRYGFYVEAATEFAIPPGTADASYEVTTPDLQCLPHRSP
jgi:hypothetical protein